MNPSAFDLEETVYALDATTIDVNISLCPWAPYARSRGAVKPHTLLDLRGSIPTFIDITHGQLRETVPASSVGSVFRNTRRKENSISEEAVLARGGSQHRAVR
jgi:hypothetical protein